MKNAPELPKPEPLPLAKAFSLKELPGRVGKWLPVPPGRQGVALAGDGRGRTFPPGRHPVLSARQRLLGRGADLKAGYLPGGPFAAWLQSGYLLSGDDELLEASLLCAVEVVDAVRFFSEVVLPRREIKPASLELDEESATQTLGVLARQYAGADLVHGLPTSRLLPEVQSRLAPVLANQGLRLAALQALSFSRADDRAAVAEKKQALEERLRLVELEQKMAEIENQVQLKDFLHQLDPALVEQAGLRAVTGELAGDQAEEGHKQSVLEVLRTWVNIETRKNAEGRHWRIEGLFRRHGKKEDEGLPPAHRAERWWLPRALWIAFILTTGVGLTRLINWIASAASWDSRWEVLLIIWGFVIGGVLESIKALYEKREAFAERQWPALGTTYLDDLSGNSRARADALVRQQCSRELIHSRDTLHDLRSRVYRAGNADLALRLRDLERKFETAADQVQKTSFGPAPYLADLKVSRQVWGDYLDYDEQLLVRVSALGEDTHEVQQKYAQGDITSDLLNQLEGRLDAFLHRFAKRSQALRAQYKDQERYRMDSVQA